MEKIEIYKSKVVGKKISTIFHTEQGEGIEHLNGLGNAYYFSTVLELENGTKYRFDNNYISDWDDSETLFEVTHENWGIEKNINFKHFKITDILIDEYSNMYIKLENEVVIYHSNEYGDKLFFCNYASLFDSQGNLQVEKQVKPVTFTSLWQLIKAKFNF